MTSLATRSAHVLLTVASLLLTVFVPLAAATVSDVTTTVPDNTTIGISTPVDITLKFASSTVLDITHGQPTLNLNNGLATAFYNGTSGTFSSLTFRYTVQGGLAFTPLDVTALNLNGAMLDGAVDPNGPTVPSGVLGAHNVSVNGNRIGIIAFTAPSGTSHANDSVVITVTFGAAPTGTGTSSTGSASTLSLNTGGVANFTNFLGGTNTATYTYHVTAGENTTALNVVSFNYNTATFDDGSGRILTNVPASGAIGALNAGQTVIIDTTPAPTVTAVSTTLAAGTIGANIAIPILVDFTTPVTVTGTPIVGLSLSGKSASYISGSGTTELTFTYTTVSGDTTSALALASTTALNLNGGTIKDVYSANAVLTLPTAALNHLIAIDTTAPTVAVSATASAAGPARPVDVAITFSEAVTGLTTLTVTNGVLNSGPTALSGTAASTVWTARVTATSTAALGVQVPANAANDLAGNGNTISNALSIPFDTTAPTVTLATTTGVIGNGQSATITATFSEVVSGFTNAGLTVTNGAVTSVSPTTADNLTWTFTVQAAGSADLTVAVNHGAAQDSAGNLNQASPAALDIPFDATAPTVQVNPNGNLTNTVPVYSLHFSEPVSGLGTSGLILTNGSAGAPAGTGSDYTVTVAPAPTAVTVAGTPAGSSTIFVTAATPTTLAALTPVEIAGTTYLTANFAPLALGTTSAAITLATPLVITIPVGTPIFATTVAVGCQVKANAAADTAGNLNTASTTATQTYDPIAPLAVITSGDATSPDVVTDTGVSPVVFILHVSKAVQGLVASDLATNGTVIGQPTLLTGTSTFLPGWLDYQIVVTPASPTTTVTCRLPVGVVADTAGNPNQASNTASISYDSRPLTVSILSSQASPSNLATLVFTVTFNKPLIDDAFTLDDLIAVNGTVAQGFDTGDHQTFTIDVTPTGDGEVTLQVLDQSISDEFGVFYHVQPADIASVVSDRTAPSITALTVTNATGTYGLGANLVIAATISETVTVTTSGGPGRPTFPLDSSATASAIFANGSGTTLLNFNYTVAAGDAANPLALANGAVLALNGTTIKDAAGNVIAINLPALIGGSALIDTSGATITGVDSTLGSGVYGAGQVVPIVVHFSKPVQVTGTPTLSLTTNTGTGNVTIISYTSGTGSTALTFTYTVGTGQTSPDLDYDGVNALSLAGGTINDLFNNAANLTLPAVGSATSLAGTRTLVVNTTDLTVPTVTTTAFTTPAGTYTTLTGSTVTTIGINVVFNRAVGVVGTPFLVMNDLATGHTTPTALYASGSGSATLAFVYTVAATDSTTVLDYADTGSLRTDAADTITNVAVPATLTLPTPGAPGSLEASATIAINPGGGATGKPPATALPAASGNAATCGLGSGIASIFAALFALSLGRRRRRV